MVASESPDWASDAQALADPNERDISVWCTFSRGAAFATHIGNVVSATDGDSFFQFPPHVTQMRLSSLGHDYIIHRNQRREYAGASARIRATSGNSARSIFLAGLTPALDHWSYVTNTPIAVNDVVCEDIKHNVTVRTYTTPYPTVSFAPGNQKVPDQLVSIFGIYREAKNSRSPFWRFLCYFKILEAVFDHLRPDLFERARKHGISLARQKEVVPRHPELQKMAPQYIGKPIKQLVDNELGKEYRNAVAHFLRSDGDPMNPSDSVTVARFGDILLVAELSARTVMEQQRIYYEDFEIKLAQLEPT